MRIADGVLGTGFRSSARAVGHLATEMFGRLNCGSSLEAELEGGINKSKVLTVTALSEPGKGARSVMEGG